MPNVRGWKSEIPEDDQELPDEMFEGAPTVRERRAMGSLPVGNVTFPPSNQTVLAPDWRTLPREPVRPAVTLPEDFETAVKALEASIDQIEEFCKTVRQQTAALRARAEVDHAKLAKLEEILKG